MSIGSSKTEKQYLESEQVVGDVALDLKGTAIQGKFNVGGPTPWELRVPTVDDSDRFIVNIEQVMGETTRVPISDGGGTITVDSGAGQLSVNINDIDAIFIGPQVAAFSVPVTLATDEDPITTQDLPATSGGLSKFHLVSAASTNATNVKASAGQVYAITAFNLNAAARYLKFHNTAGTPTAGSGVTESFLIPGNTAGAGFVINFDKGIAFSTGIGITLVTGIADSDSTGVAANEVLVNVYYK